MSLDVRLILLYITMTITTHVQYEQYTRLKREISTYHTGSIEHSVVFEGS